MSKLVFTSDRGGETSLYIAELESVPITIRKVKTKPLKASPWYNRVAWTPDSKHIIAAIKDADGDNLYEINVNTHEAVRLSQFTGKSIKNGVDLSRDGRTALYVTGNRLESFDLNSKTTKVIQADFLNFYAVTWSPDKKWISFQSNDHGWDSFILPSDGGKAIQILPDRSHSIGAPAWSSNSQELFYHKTSQAEYTHQIGLTDISTRQETILTDKIKRAFWKWGVWSPNSRYIALYDGVDKETDEADAASILRLHVLDIKTKTSKYLASASLTNYKPAYKTPVWLSDSSGMFSVVNDDKGFPELAHISIPKGTVEILTHSQTPKHDLAISPDDELIAFVEGNAKDENIWIYDFVLDESYQLTNTKGRKTELVFSPSVSKLLFHRILSSGESELVVMNIENGQIEKRIDNPGYMQRFPRWLDEETIAFKSTDGSTFVYRIHSLDGNQRDIAISSPNGILVSPNLIDNNQKMIFRNGGVFGNLYIQDLAKSETSILIETLADSPIVSPDERSVAYTRLDENRQVKATRIWRADLAHIVPPDRLP